MFGLEDDLAAGIGADESDDVLSARVKVTRVALENLDTTFRQGRGQRAAVEYAPFAGTALYKGHPFFEELFVGRLADINSGVIGQ